MLKYFLKKHLFVITCCTIIFVIYLLLIFQQRPLHTSSDDLGTIATAAKLSGYDWSGVISGVGYYGAGYYIIFTGLFKIIDNPITLFRIILISNALVRIAIIPIAYYISEKFLKIKSRRMCALLGVMVANISQTRISNISNEYIQELLVWLCILLFCKMIYYYSNRKKKAKYMLLLTIFLMYGLTIHTRALTLLIAITISAILLSVIYHKNFFTVKHILFGALLYILCQWLVKWVQNYVWGTNEGLRNASVTVQKDISVYDPKTWLLWLDMIIGNIGTMTIFTGGLFILCIIAVIYGLIQLFKLKALHNGNIYILAITFPMILSLGAVILALLVSTWFTGSFPSFSKNEIGNSIYAYKGMTYIRYWGIYVPPLILCGFALMDKYSLWRKLSVIFLISTVILISCFISMVLPWIKNNANCFGPFYGMGAFKHGEKVNINNYYCSILLSMDCLFIYLLCFYKRKKEAGIAVLCAFFIFQQVEATIQVNVPIQKEMYSLIDASIDRIHKMEQTDFNLYAIEMDKNRDNNWKQCYILQFYLPYKTIKTQLPENLKKGDVILTRHAIKDGIINNQDFDEIKLDENEYWYVYQ